MELLDQLCREMIAYDKGDPRRIHHFLKVHAGWPPIIIPTGV